MCAETETKPYEGTAKIDNLAVTGRLYIEGKNRPILVSSDPLGVEFDIRACSRGDLDALIVMNVHGENTTVPRQRIVSFVRDVPKMPRVQIDSTAFAGKQYTFRGLTDTGSLFYEVQVPDPQNYVAVVAEGMAAALVVVLNPENGYIVWQNPAEPERSLRRLVKAARLIAEADVLTCEANEPESRGDASPAPRWDTGL